MTVHVLAATALLAQGGSQGGGLTSFLPLLLLLGVFWFIIMRPQQKRMRDHRALLSSVKQGDKVVAAGGIVGTVRRIDDDILSLQVADNVVLKVDRGTVQKKLS
jgi:preprotein translocase subunit YajC